MLPGIIYGNITSPRISAAGQTHTQKGPGSTMAAVNTRGRDALLLKLAQALADHPRASMEQLATMSGVSRATLFRHFPSRDDMMAALSEAGILRAEEAVARAQLHDGCVEHALQRLIDELLPIAELYAHVDAAMRTDEALQERIEPLHTTLTDAFRYWQAAGALRVDMSAVWLVESLSALLRSTATMIRAGRLARHDAAQSIFALLWQGMAK